jgi:hypothetical protein
MKHMHEEKIIDQWSPKIWEVQMLLKERMESDKYAKSPERG